MIGQQILELFIEAGWLLIIPAITAVLSLVIGILYKRGYGKLAATFEAASPYVVDALQRVIDDKKITKAEAKAEGVKALVKTAPLIVRALSGGVVRAQAGQAVESAHSASKIMGDSRKQRIQEVGIAATADGNQLGAEVAAKFRKGAISVTGGKGKNGFRAGIEAKFKL